MAQTFNDAKNELDNSHFLKDLFQRESELEKREEMLEEKRKPERPKERIPYPY